MRGRAGCQILGQSHHRSERRAGSLFDRPAPTLAVQNVVTGGGSIGAGANAGTGGPVAAPVLGGRSYGIQQMLASQPVPALHSCHCCSSTAHSHAGQATSRPGPMTLEYSHRRRRRLRGQHLPDGHHHQLWRQPHPERWRRQQHGGSARCVPGLGRACAHCTRAAGATLSVWAWGQAATGRPSAGTACPLCCLPYLQKESPAQRLNPVHCSATCFYIHLAKCIA